MIQLGDDIKYFSDNGIPLITQHIDLLFCDGERKPVLTVENYDKWYKVYIIHPDDTIEGIFNDKELDESMDSWYDHCILPNYFHELAKRKGCVYDSMTFAMVCERFVSDWLEGDWCKLAKYLPVK